MSADPAQAATAPAAAHRRPLYRSPWFYAALVGVALLTGLRTCYAKKLPTLPVLGEIPAFSLTDQRGEPFGSADLEGKVWVASFFFTSCVTVCPKISAANAELQQAFAARGLDARLVSFTVDPQVDSPERLRRYAATYGADHRYWTFLTGPKEAVFDIVAHGFKLAMGDKVADAGGVADIAHSTKLVLVDGEGRIRHYFNSLDPAERQLLVDHVAHLASEEAHQ